MKVLELLESVTQSAHTIEKKKLESMLNTGLSNE